MTSTSEKSCIRSDPNTPHEQCAKCLFRHPGGEPLDPLVNVLWSKSGKAIKITCLTGRQIPDGEIWKHMELNRGPLFS